MPDDTSLDMVIDGAPVVTMPPFELDPDGAVKLYSTLAKQLNPSTSEAEFDEAFEQGRMLAVDYGRETSYSQARSTWGFFHEVGDRSLNLTYFPGGISSGDQLSIKVDLGREGTLGFYLTRSVGFRFSFKPFFMRPEKLSFTGQGIEPVMYNGH